MTASISPPAVSPEEFDELETILDDLRTRDPEVPQWEFCEGFLTAVVCCREPITDPVALQLLLPEFEDEAPMFASPEQRERWTTLWGRRRNEIATQLATEVESLADEAALSPEVMDLRGAVACLPEDEAQAWRAENPDADALPSFAQMWAMGFMHAVDCLEDAWAPPRDAETKDWLDESLDAVVALTESDTGKPEHNLHQEDGPPSVSDDRLNAFGRAVWAVYDLHQIWRSLGPKVGTIVKPPKPGRNDPCYCGSGKKYKHCHGAQ